VKIGRENRAADRLVSCARRGWHKGFRAERSVPIGLALAWAGWGAIAAQRFSADSHGFVFGTILGISGMALVVLSRIPWPRSSPVSGEIDPLATRAIIPAGPRKMRTFRELAPEAPRTTSHPKN